MLINNNKSKLGQFYTTNYNYILQNFVIPIDVSSIIEPFAGNGDLLNFIQKFDNSSKDKDILNFAFFKSFKEILKSTAFNKYAALCVLDLIDLSCTPDIS